MEAWKEGYVAGGAAAAFGGESGHAAAVAASERVREWSVVRSGVSRRRRARGGGGRPWLPRGGRRRRMVATRRSRSGAGRDAAHGNGAAQRGGRPCARGGLSRTRGGRAAGAVAGRAGFDRGPRSEAAARERIETLFNFLFSRKFQIAVFKYPFEQENDFF